MSADLYERPKAREYRELMDAIEGRGQFGEDAYGSLMSKERRVLDTVDRVVNDARLQSTSERLFTNLSMAQIVANTARVVHAIYRDLVRARSLDDVVRAFTPMKRRIYVGLILVAASLFMMAIRASS